MKEIIYKFSQGECIDLLDFFNDLCYNNILKLVIFTRTNNQKEFTKKKNMITQCLRQNYGYKGPVSIISQPPIHSEYCIEIWRTSQNFEYREYGGITYSLISGETEELVTEAIVPDSKILGEACDDVFKKAQELLRHENLDFSNVIRQWNYIENITNVKSGQQNYQIFNEIRAKYYDEVNFSRGYPAATGIGMSCGLVNLELIATNHRVNISCVENEKQIPPSEHSGEVLYKGNRPPKFSRGKLKNKELYISGTASIIKQESQFPGLVEKQTNIAIENVKRVIRNAKKENNDFSSFRVYVKYPEQERIIAASIKKELNTENFVLLETDICREELMVEIEGYVY